MKKTLEKTKCKVQLTIEDGIIFFKIYMYYFSMTFENLKETSYLVNCKKLRETFKLC